MQASGTIDVAVIGVCNTTHAAQAGGTIGVAAMCERWHNWRGCYARTPLTPHHVAGPHMHSYVYIGGSFIGNGFSLLENPNEPRVKPGTASALLCNVRWLWPMRRVCLSFSL